MHSECKKSNETILIILKHFEVIVRTQPQTTLVGMATEVALGSGVAHYTLESRA